MITEENLKKMYEGIISGKELTTKELNSYGFNQYDLKKLMEQKTLKRIKRGHYEIEKNNKKEYSFAAIFDAFMKKDIDKVLRLLKVYLNNINRKEYEFLIVDLIKISLIEKDEFFTKPILELMKLDKEDYKFNLKIYDNCFREMTRLKKNRESSIYLDIINNYNNLTPKKHDIIEKNYESIKEKGFIILEVSQEEKKQIFKVLKNYDDIKLMELSENKIILKYLIHTTNIDYKSLIKEGIDAYNDQNYILCIENLRKALAFYYTPGTWLFAKIGITYWNINNIPLALDYLTVATELSKNEDNKYDFTNLIEMLKKQEKKKELKLKI